MTITIINTRGCAPRTSHMELSAAQTHIAARDRLAAEAEILLAFFAAKCDSDPVAWKYADPTEDGRFIFDESEVAEIARQDPGLIERIEVQWAETV